MTYVRSLTDTVARLNMNMHGDDPSYFRLPDNRDEASQYLFLYELSLGYGMDLTDQIDIDRGDPAHVGFHGQRDHDRDARGDGPGW